MKVIISESIHEEAYDLLARCFEVERNDDLWRDPTALCSALADADGLLVRNQTQVTAELLAAASRLQVVGRHGTGLDNIDVMAATERGVVVTSTPEENAMSVAEHAFALMLAAARHIPRGDAAIRSGEWPREALTGVELYGKTLGLLGLGRVGFRVAIRARAFGMRVVAYDPYLTHSAPTVTESGAELLDDIEAVLEQADVISVHLPLTPETRLVLNAERLARVKRGAILVNTSRGQVLDEAALVAALSDGRLGAAALDVRAVEPPPADDPLQDLDNVVLTPHIAAFTDDAQRRVAETVAGDMTRVLTGHPARFGCNLARPRRP